MFLCNVDVKGTLNPQVFMKSDLAIDCETRHKLNKKEQWHFCVLQQAWFIIAVLMTSLFELLIFALGYFGTDYAGCDDKTGTMCLIVTKFKFMCAVGATSTWYIENTAFSMTLFKLHFVVIFMYTTVFIIVLFKIPYKYDRISKTNKEKKADKKQRAKRRARRRGLKQKDISHDLRAQVLKYQEENEKPL